MYTDCGFLRLDWTPHSQPCRSPRSTRKKEKKNPNPNPNPCLRLRPRPRPRRGGISCRRRRMQKCPSRDRLIGLAIRSQYLVGFFFESRFFFCSGDGGRGEGLGGAVVFSSVCVIHGEDTYITCMFVCVYCLCMGTCVLCGATRVLAGRCRDRERDELGRGLT